MATGNPFSGNAGQLNVGTDARVGPPMQSNNYNPYSYGSQFYLPGLGYNLPQIQNLWGGGQPLNPYLGDILSPMSAQQAMSGEPYGTPQGMSVMGIPLFSGQPMPTPQVEQPAPVTPETAYTDRQNQPEDVSGKEWYWNNGQWNTRRERD